MLILLLFPVLLKVLLLIGLLIWFWRILRGLVLPLNLPVGSVGRKAQVRVGISLSAVPMLLLLHMLLMSLIGGSPLNFLFSLAFLLMLGWLMLLARLFVSQSGLHVGWILLMATRVVQDVWDVYREG